jgi:hypothetical protein
LLVSVREAHRLSRATERAVELPHHAVTKFRQPKGAKRWAWHPEQAQCGRMGGMQSIFVRPRSSASSCKMASCSTRHGSCGFGHERAV